MKLRSIFIENLKSYRKKSKLSQQQLAEKCEIATNYLSEIERGQKFPSIELIERFSKELETPAFLFFINGKIIADNNLLEKQRNQEFSDRLINDIKSLLNEYGFTE